MAVWEGNPAILNDLVFILRDFSTPDTNVQREVQIKWSNFQEIHQDTPLYLLRILITSNNTQISQLATLLLRRSIDRAPSLADWVREILKNGLLEAITSPAKEIRDAASAALCSLFTLEGFKNWPELPSLLFNLIMNDSNLTASMGASSALYDICIEFICRDADFLKFVSDSIVPHMTQCRSTRMIDRNFFGKLICLLYENTNLVWTVHFKTIWLFTAQTMQILTRLHNANNPVDELSVSVMKIVNETWYHNPDAVINTVDLIVLFILNIPVLMTNNNFDNDKISKFQVESLEFFPRVLRQNQYNEKLRPAIVRVLEPHLRSLVTYLVNLTQYSEADYMSMDHSQLENNNSNIPDRVQDIAIRYNHRDDLSDTDNNYSTGNTNNTWGSIWTTRKASALAIDHLSLAFGPRMLDNVLDLIERKLTDTNWEVVESSILTLGAIARGCYMALSPFLPKVLPYLFDLAKNDKPLMRSIACWCISRFSSWISMSGNADFWVPQVLNSLLDRVLDNNKRVQEAACSSLATFVEESYCQVTLHFELICSVVDRAFNTYQHTNLLLLYDVLGQMIEAEERIQVEGYADDRFYEAMRKFSLRGFVYRQLSGDWNVALNTSNSFTQQWTSKYVSITDCTSILMRSEHEHVDLSVFNPFVILNVIHKILVTDLDDPELPMGVYESSYDVLSALIEYYGLELKRSFETLTDFMPLLIQSVGRTEGSALSAGLALIGDFSFKMADLLVEHVPMILTIACHAIDDFVEKANSRKKVQSLHPMVNNAAWVIGTLCDCITNKGNFKISFSFTPHIEQVFGALSLGIRCVDDIASSGSSAALGKFTKAFPDFMKSSIFGILGVWSRKTIALKNIFDKEVVVLAMCSIIDEVEISRIDYNELICFVHLLASTKNIEFDSDLPKRLLEKIEGAFTPDEWARIIYHHQ